LTAGRRSFWIATAAAMCIAVGKVSLDDWPMLTWSLGWTPPCLMYSASLELADGLVLAEADEVGDDLVGVHVGAGARAGLVDVDGEVLGEAAESSGRPAWISAAGLDDRLGACVVEAVEACG
jgi:hypothetical protein